MKHTRLAMLFLALFACSSKGSESEPKATPQASNKAASAAQPGTQGAEPLAPAQLAAASTQVHRSTEETRSQRTKSGETREWKLLEGIEVSAESFKELYVSDGSHFVAFKADVKVGTESCLVDWRSELKASPGGRGATLGQSGGVVPAPAGATLVLSGVVALSSEELAKVGSASAGYWTLCGDQLPSPSALDVDIVETRAEQIKFGKSFDLHHTVFALDSAKLEAKAPMRCYFDLVAEDVDESGYTLNRDFASFSLRAGTSAAAKLRRTSFEGGRERDFADLAKSKRSYLRDLHCEGRWDPKTAQIEGLSIRKLGLVPYEGPATSAVHLVRAAFGHTATIENTTGRDCSFRIRYRALDTSGVPMSESALLSQQIHLAKGQSVDFKSERERLYVWKEQAAELGSLVAELARPVDDCQRFDSTKLAK